MGDKMNNMISIILPVYNGEKYIQTLIDSITNQEYLNYELIIINDGSTDNTENICLKNIQKNSKIKYFTKKNSGVSDTRNFGIKKSIGDYICFIDADDILSTKYLSDFIDAFSQNEYDMVSCSYKKIYSDAIPEKDISECIIIKEYTEENMFEILYDKYGGYLWNKIFKRKIIIDNKITFNKDIAMSEDMLFIFEYLKCSKKVGCFDKENYYYRIIKSSASKKLSNERWFTIFKTFDEIKKDKKIFSTKFYNRLMYAYIFYLYEAIYRLKYIKKSNNYKEISEKIEERIRNINFNELSLSKKQRIKIFLYKYFNYISFKIKRG